MKHMELLVNGTGKIRKDSWFVKKLWNLDKPVFQTRKKIKIK